METSCIRVVYPIHKSDKIKNIFTCIAFIYRELNNNNNGFILFFLVQEIVFIYNHFDALHIIGTRESRYKFPHGYMQFK